MAKSQNFATNAKQVIVGVALTGAATLLTHELATAFNVTGITLVVVDLIPTFLGVGLLLKSLDVF